MPPKNTRQRAAGAPPGIVWSQTATSFSHNGQLVRLKRGEPWWDDDPVVLANSDLFGPPNTGAPRTSVLRDSQGRIK